MSTDTNPPVGATVVDVHGMFLGHRAEGDPTPSQIAALAERLTADVPRFSMAIVEGVIAPREAEAGTWVRFADYARMQQRAEQAEAELAKLRALAVEAKATTARLDAQVSISSAMRAAVDQWKRLAALATPNQENTP